MTEAAEAVEAVEAVAWLEAQTSCAEIVGISGAIHDQPPPETRKQPPHEQPR
jgi:hypothetical protein